MAEQKVPFGRQFWSMGAGSLLFFCSFNLPVPEFGAHLEAIGYPELKPLIIPLFSMMALLSRPFSGVMTDTIGRKPVMMAGAMVCFVCALFYPFASWIGLFLLLRTLHGLAAGFTPTGSTAYIADTVHPSRRGEAMGMSGLMSNVGTALGFAIGPLLAVKLGRDWMYGLAAAMALAALYIFIRLPESLWRRRRFEVGLLRIRPKDIIDWQVWEPSVVMLLVCMNLGAVLTVMPDFTRHLGYENKGLYMAIYIGSSLLVRILSGKLSDRHGRTFSIVLGTSCLSISMLLITWTEAAWVLYPSAVFFGFGQGFNAPAMFAWTTDLSRPEMKGRSLATIFIALEAGITLGGLGGGYLYNNRTENLHWVFALCALCAVSALVFTLLRRRQHAKPDYSKR
ncbi:MAG: MFS transporter [Bacteroidia bacterium]